MNIEIFNPGVINAIGGGLLIGASATLMMLMNGRIAGISGIFFQLRKPSQKPAWQLAFIVGLLGGAFLYFHFTKQAYPQVLSSWELALIGGFIVGVGTRLGSGCTSGHGVCGISRFSPRSIVATLTFMSTGILTASLFSIFS